MVDEKSNARYYENSKERLRKLNMDKYYPYKEIILEKKTLSC